MDASFDAVECRYSVCCPQGVRGLEHLGYLVYPRGLLNVLCITEPSCVTLSGKNITRQHFPCYCQASRTTTPTAMSQSTTTRTDSSRNSPSPITFGGEEQAKARLDSLIPPSLVRSGFDMTGHPADPNKHVYAALSKAARQHCTAYSQSLKCLGKEQAFASFKESHHKSEVLWRDNGLCTHYSMTSWGPANNNIPGPPPYTLRHKPLKRPR
jgi:hypothetical protein